MDYLRGNRQGSMHFFSNLFYLSITGFSLLNLYLKYRTKRSQPNYAWKFLDREIPHIHDLAPSLKKRIDHYLFANAVTTDWFARLHGMSLSDQERQASILLAAATPIADYMVDDLQLSKSDILESIKNPRNEILDLISSTLYYRCRSLHSDTLQFEMYFHKTLAAQEQSLAQSDLDVPIETLRKITWKKGGYALLLYRSVLGKEMTRQEEDAIFQIGGLMQLHNDIFDIYRDHQDGINTLPLAIENMITLERVYRKEVLKSAKAIENLKFGTHRYRQFFALFHLIVQTGFLCIDHYKKLTVSNNYILNVGLYQRSDLIFDMDSIKNISRVILRTLQQRP